MKHFKKSEFACPCGCGLSAISLELAKRLDDAREEAGVPFIITSGCRCEAHNQKLVEDPKYKASPDSSHKLGFAADISAVGKNRERIISAVRKYFDRIGIGNNFVHVDVDPNKAAAEWRY